MTKKRLWHMIRLAMIRGEAKRAQYIRKHGIYAHYGDNVSIQSRFLPIYSELISFHNNIIIARNVDFCTHDVTHAVLNRLPEDERKSIAFKEKIGCIEIMDNTFVGSNSVILYNTRIGPNVIIGSGSVVTKDTEPNSVYAGVPARRIGSYEDFIKKRIQQEANEEIATTVHNQHLTKEETEKAWRIFNKAHDA